MSAAASYAGVDFEVAADRFGYPNPDAPDRDGVVRVRVLAQFASRADRNSVAGKTSEVDWVKPLGVLRAVPWQQAGYGPASLVLPTKTGRDTTYSSAYLESFEDARGYGRKERDLWRATLTFAIDGSGNT